MTRGGGTPPTCLSKENCTSETSVRKVLIYFGLSTDSFCSTAARIEASDTSMRDTCPYQPTKPMTTFRSMSAAKSRRLGFALVRHRPRSHLPSHRPAPTTQKRHKTPQNATKEPLDPGCTAVLVAAFGRSSGGKATPSSPAGVCKGDPSIT